MNRTYSTRAEAIAQEIVGPILAGSEALVDDYDIEAIADAVLDDYAHGYACKVDPQEFWATAERNAR